MKRGLYFGYVVLGYIFFNTKVVECITCLNCQNITDIGYCKDFLVCQEDEACYIDKVLSPSTLQPLYNTGCKKMEYCKLEFCNKKAYGDGNTRRKKATDGEELTLCSHCCYDDSCNAEGCGYKHPLNNNTKCFSCKEVYEGGPPCIETKDCDLDVFACSVTNHLGSIHPGAYELGCKFKRKQCDLYVRLEANQKDKNVKCCDTTLCNVSPYNRKVNKTAIAIDFECPTGIARPTTTPAPSIDPPTITTITRPPLPVSTPDPPTITTITRPPLPVSTPDPPTITTITRPPLPVSTPDPPKTTTFTRPPLPVSTPVRYPNQCSFDQNNLCSWTQGSTDDFDWTIHSGPTQTSDTGPSADHTVGNAQGKYLYIEASAPNDQGEFARLESPTLSTNRKTCLSLWYYMYGDGIGNLTILLHKSQNTKSETVLFNISGDQGPRWCPAAVEIKTSPVVYDYKLVIQGDVGVTYHGDIAIDDLLISDTNCTAIKCNKSDVSASIVG